MLGRCSCSGVALGAVGGEGSLCGQTTHKRSIVLSHRDGSVRSVHGVLSAEVRCVGRARLCRLYILS